MKLGIVLLCCLSYIFGYTLASGSQESTPTVDEIGMISNTGMWLIQDGKIGIVIEGDHVLTIYRDGIPDCQEVR